MIAAGRTLTVGELRAALAELGDNDPVTVRVEDSDYLAPATRVDSGVIEVAFDGALPEDGASYLEVLERIRDTKKLTVREIRSMVAEVL